MNLLFCTTEIRPYSKEGGLADFSASLTNQLNSINNKVSVVSPYYREVIEKYGDKAVFIGREEIKFGSFMEVAEYYLIVKDGIEYYFVSHPYFDRKNYYDYRDDAKRFIFFSHAILKMLELINYYPDVIHINNWQTALIPYIKDTLYLDNLSYQNIKTLLSIHTLERQGSFPMAVETFFTKKNYTYEHYGQINFLKAGIMRASKINTVSKTYRSEILTDFFGFSLNGALKSRETELIGIQNRISFDYYNPLTNQDLFYNYDFNSFEKGKLENKQELLKSIGFNDFNKPIISVVGRLAREKGLDLILDIIDDYLKEDKLYFLVSGQGDFEYEDVLNSLMDKYPNNVYYHKGYDEKLYQNLFAATDIFLMPSLYEASGYNQMIAMRYGAIPIVRSTGGLKDTVKHYNEAKNSGTGFLFKNYDSTELDDILNYVINIYNNKPDVWNKIIVNAMQEDNGIDKMVKEYQSLYEELLIDK